LNCNYLTMERTGEKGDEKCRGANMCRGWALIEGKGSGSSKLFLESARFVPEGKSGKAKWKISDDDRVFSF